MADIGPLPDDLQIGHPSNATTWGGYSSESHVHFSIAKEGVLQEISPYVEKFTTWEGDNIGVTLYEHANYQGRSITISDTILDLCLFPLDPSTSPVDSYEECFQFPSWTDNASSIKVAPGWNARLHKHNEADAAYWGDDASQGFVCDEDIPDFGDLTFPDGTPLDNNVSRIYVWRCGASAANSNHPGVHAPLDHDPCDPEPAPVTDDSAEFIRDVTLPDGYITSAGQTALKTWRLRNSSTTTWGNGYQLAFVSGEQMGAPNAVSVPATAPGETADLSVNITAPGEPGSHTGTWQLRNPQGTYFGPRLSVQIVVGSASSYISTLTADPPSPADAEHVTIHARADGFPNFRAMRLKIDGDVVYELGAPEITYDWHTDGYDPGDHSIVVEVADQTDTSWSQPETRSMTYTLLGTAGSTNRSPHRPDPDSPYDWYTYYDGNTATLCAQANGDPDGDAISGYQFDVYDSPETWNSGWVSNNCTTTAALGPHTYQWRVKVRDSQGAESEWSDSWHFTLVNPDLTIDELYFEPLDGDSERVRIRACTSGQGGVGITMRVSVNDASDGSDSGDWHIIKELGVPCFNEVDAPVWRTLPYGDGPHRVKVEAHGADESWDGAAVREETYTLPHRRPASPRLAAPVPRSQDIRDPIYLNTRAVTFRWEPALRAESYTLHVGDSPSPKDDASPVFRQSFGPDTTQHTVTLDQNYPTLYWQVEAANDAGSNASGDQLFGIDRADPACTVASLPGVTYESVFQVSWGGTDNLSGVRTFDVQYLDSGRSSWQDWLVAVPMTKTTELFTGQPGHSYAFRCRATDNANNTGAYPSAADAATLVDPSARPPTPWWNSSYSHKRNLTILNNAAAQPLPAGYPVRVRFDSATTPTAAELYEASQSATPCDDLRVVHDDTAELDRIVQACSGDAIEIWFRSQVEIPAGDADSDAHQLYYGNPDAGAPPADPNTVWYPVDESDTTNLYFFQEGSGGTAYDASGNGRHCSLDGSVQWSAAKFGHGLRFDRANAGDSRSLDCGAVPALSAFTIEFWYRPDADDAGRIAGALSGGGNGGGGNNWLLQNVDGRVRLDVWPCSTCGSSDVQSNFNLRDAAYVGRWNHIAVTFNGGNEVSFYINGAHDVTRTLSQSGINTYSPPLEIGSAEGIGQIKANLGAFRISSAVKGSFPYGGFAAILDEPTTAAGAVVEPPATGSPDLALLDLTTYPNPEGGVLVQAVFQNQGDRETQNGFYTDLYLDHLPGGPGDDSGRVQFWVNDPVAAGSTVTLTRIITDLATLAPAAPAGLDATAEVSGTLYAQVDATGVVGEPDDDNNIYSSGAAVCLVAPDAYEDDDAWQTATPLPLDTVQAHNVHKLGDEDWLAIEATGGQSYAITTSDLGPSADTYLYLYDGDGTTLLASNDDAAGTLASRIEWTPPASGTYYLLVKHWNPNASGCGTDYNVVFHNVSIVSDFPVHLPVLFARANE